MPMTAMSDADLDVNFTGAAVRLTCRYSRQFLVLPRYRTRDNLAVAVLFHQPEPYAFMIDKVDQFFVKDFQHFVVHWVLALFHDDVRQFLDVLHILT